MRSISVPDSGRGLLAEALLQWKSGGQTAYHRVFPAAKQNATIPFRADVIPLPISDLEPDPGILAHAIRVMKSNLEKGIYPDSYDPRLLRILPWILIPTRKHDGIEPDSGILESLVTLSAERFDDVSVLALMKNFFMVFPVRSAGFRILGQCIYTLLSRRADHPVIKPWHRCCDRFRLLERRGAKNLAESILAAAAFPMEYLRAMGFSNRLLKSELVRRMTLEYLTFQSYRFMERPLNDIEFEQMCSSIRDSDGRVRFPEQINETVAILLSPFKVSDVYITPFQRERIRRFCLEHIGDPEKDKANMRMIPMDIQQVLIRWNHSIPLYVAPENRR